MTVINRVTAGELLPLPGGDLVVGGFFIVRAIGPVIFRAIDTAVERQEGRGGNGSETEAFARPPDQRPAVGSPGQLPGFVGSCEAHLASQRAGFNELDFR